MTDKAKSNIGYIIQIAQVLASVAMVVFLVGVWKGNAESGQAATGRELQQVANQVEALNVEVKKYAEENRALHAALAEQFVTRREWLLLLNHAGETPRIR